jgi:hypothetical protein
VPQHVACKLAQSHFRAPSYTHKVCSRLLPLTIQVRHHRQQRWPRPAWAWGPAARRERDGAAWPGPHAIEPTAVVHDEWQGRVSGTWPCCRQPRPRGRHLPLLAPPCSARIASSNATHHAGAGSWSLTLVSWPDQDGGVLGALSACHLCSLSSQGVMGHFRPRTLWSRPGIHHVSRCHVQSAMIARSQPR